jgi:hypothetical protein
MGLRRACYQGDAFRPEESADGKVLFYGRFGTHCLWSPPGTGGKERQVLDSIAEMNWTVTPKGIYYFDFKVPPEARNPVKFYSFKTGEATQVGTAEPTVSWDYSGISVSPNGRWLPYSYIANVNSDLMLVDDFRW